MGYVTDQWSQLYPPKPQFTEADLPDLAGKVYIVTGSNTGVGKELAQMLYGKDAKVYVAARSEEKSAKAIEAIKTAHPGSTGELVFLHLDLADLSTIKASADAFLAQESKLHVLFNNAGVMTPPQGSKTAQGYELQLGTNNLGHFLFTQLLTPTLAATARAEPPNTVRVVWVSSSMAEFGPRPGGVDMTNLDYKRDKSPQHKYAVSKAGNFLHAVAYARRHGEGKDGIVSIALNPGNLSSELVRHRGTVEKLVLKWLIQHPTKLGAYTELFAGLSPEVTLERIKKDNWIVPWGRFLPIRKDINLASKPESEGGTGLGEKWWQWSEEQVKQYM